MIIVQFVVLLAFVAVGARIGGIAIGLAGGAGVVVLGLLGLDVDPATQVPWTVLGIIMCVIAAMQAAGGLDYLVWLTERILRSRPRNITFLAPLVTWLMTIFAGTGQVAFSTLPVIAEVAKDTGVRPSRPLSIAVVASQMAIVASPISAAVVFMAGVVDPLGVSFAGLLGLTMTSTFVGCLVGAVVASRLGAELEDDPVYRERLAQGLVRRREHPPERAIAPHPAAVRSVVIFGAALLLAVAYAILADTVLTDPTIDLNGAIMGVMLLAGLLIVVLCKVDPGAILGQQTFRSGMSAAVCIVGVAWLGKVFIDGHTDAIVELGGDLIARQPWTLALVLLIASALLYSQGATTTALMPVAAQMGVAASTMVAAFPAVTGLFLLPTYTTVVAAIELDDTGTTRIGRYLFNHSFMVPGLVSVGVALLVGFGLGSVILG